MATLTSYGTTATAVTGTWTTLSNAVFSPGTFASLTTTVVNTYDFDITGHGFADSIASDADIDAVRVTIPHYVSNTSRWTAPTIVFRSGGAQVTSATLTLSNSSSFQQTVTLTGITAAQLRDAAAAFRYRIPKSGTQSATVNVDFIQVDIDYRSESWQEVKL